MFQEFELEEGEACCYKDDASIDPDTAPSYIGVKVQSILGHHQKDFEGEVSAEILGAKFGGYGSFLPVHQHSPVLLEPDSPQRIQNTRSLRSPNHGCPRDLAPISVMVHDDPSTQENDPPAPSVHASKTLKNSINDASSRQNADKVSKVYPGRVNLPSSNSANPLDQKSLKVCIKVGTDKLAQYNAEIYHPGLTSPFSSEENSHNDSDKLLLESDDISDESPASILQIMTSFPASGGLLLSPLNEDFLKLESVYRAARERSAISVRINKSGVSVEKRTKCFDKSKNFKQSESRFIRDLNHTKQKILGNDNVEHTLHTSHDFDAKLLDETARESGKDALDKKREKSKDKVTRRAVSGDLVEDDSLEHVYGQQLESRCSSTNKVEKHPARITQKDIIINHGHASGTGGRRNSASVNDCPNNSEGGG